MLIWLFLLSMLFGSPKPVVYHTYVVMMDVTDPVNPEPMDTISFDFPMRSVEAKYFAKLYYSDKCTKQKMADWVSVRLEQEMEVNFVIKQLDQFRKECQSKP